MHKRQCYKKLLDWIIDATKFRIGMGSTSEVGQVSENGNHLNRKAWCWCALTFAEMQRKFNYVIIKTGQGVATLPTNSY